jgi:phosphatidylinositol glycan class Q protein
MEVLGLANSPQNEIEALQIHASRRPRLRMPEISCARASAIQTILYRRPDPGRMQYISMDPITLALGDKAEMADYAPGSIGAEEEREEKKKQAETQKLVDKLKLHTVTKHALSQKELALPTIVHQVNCSNEVNQLLQKNISLVGTRSRRSLSVSERVVESATRVQNFVVLAVWQIMSLYIYPVIRWGFVMGLICQRVVAEGFLRILEWRAKPDYAALKDISATAQQVEIRLQQFCHWPIQVSHSFPPGFLLGPSTFPRPTSTCGQRRTPRRCIRIFAFILWPTGSTAYIASTGRCENERMTGRARPLTMRNTSGSRTRRGCF